MPKIEGFRPPHPTEGRIRRALYNTAEKFLAMPGKTEDFFVRHINAAEKALQPKTKPLNWAVKGFRKLQYWTLKAGKVVLVKLANHDYTEYHSVRIALDRIPFLKSFALIQKLSRAFTVATPGSGAKLILYYVGLIGPRTWRAWERGKKADGTRDYREIKDVLRRDVYTITLFVFGLGWLSSKMAQWTEKRAGIPLFSKLKDDAYSYSDHDVNAKMTHGKVLAMHYREGSKGIHQAVEKGYLSHNIIPAALRKKMAPGEFEELTLLSTQFKQALDAMKDKKDDALLSKAEEAFQSLEKMDGVRTRVLQKIKTLDHPEFKHLEKWIKDWPEYTSFLSQYAKHYRSRLDLLSFILIIFSLGYLPVAYNSRINRKAVAAKQTRDRRESNFENAVPVSPFPIQPSFQFPRIPASNTNTPPFTPFYPYPQARVAFSGKKNPH